MKDILVHVDRSPRAVVRVEAALRLARQMGGRVTGLFAQSDSDRLARVARRAGESLRAAAAEAEETFTRITAGAGVDAAWRKMPHGEPAFVTAEFAFCARYFDLVVMGQTDAEESLVPAEMVEQVILNCGRPVLTLPQFGEYPTIGRRAVCAWNASREASRAIHDAMPLLRAADEVTLLSIRAGEGVSAALDLPTMDVVEHLRAHGVNARGEHLPDELIGKTEMLLSRACDHGADLLVMGAYGHYGLSRLRGSATRHMLRHMTMPILLSN